MAFLLSLYFITVIFEDDDPMTIGVLYSSDNRVDKLDGLKTGLVDLGYDLDSLKFTAFESEETPEGLEENAKRLVENEVDVITSFGGIETQVLAKVMEEKNQMIPTVFIGMAAPKEIGIISDFRHPEGVFTGLSNHHMHLSAKRLELFIDMVPDVERMILLYSEDIDISRHSLQVAKEAAQFLGISVQPFHVGESLDFNALEDELKPGDGIMTLPSFRIEGQTDQIADFSLYQGVPVMGMYDYEVESGFLLGYGSSFYEQGVQAARQVSLLLQGNEPSDIPVELPDQISFYMNETTKKKLDVDMDKNMLKLVEPLHMNGGQGG